MITVKGFWGFAYGRDRGESGQEAEIYSNIEEWKEAMWVDYYYLWDGTNWEII